MLDNLIDRIGNWNPQLFRELKSRFTGYGFIATLGISVVSQVIWVGQYLVSNSSINSQGIGNNLYFLHWFLNWFVPIGLMLGGVYAILTDLNREEQRGTLNFIRLTPQSSRSIFLGKMLGVPSLIYVGILSIVPLHLFVGMSTGNSFVNMFAWYATIGVTTYLCLSTAVLYAVFINKYVILTTLLFSLPVTTFVGVYNPCVSSIALKLNASSGYLSWFYLPIDTNIFLFDGLIIATFLIISYWIWVTIDRKYINLYSTSLKKEHSYGLNFQLQIWLLGFALPLISQAYSEFKCLEFDCLSMGKSLYIIMGFYSISAVCVYCIIPLIMPNKSSVQEWSCYWHKHIASKHHQSAQSDLIRDLVWHDRSPIELAMLVNLSIPAMVWGLCLIIFIHLNYELEMLLKFICGIIIVSVLTLIHTHIVSFVFLRSPSRNAGVIPLIFIMSCLPLCLGIVPIITSSDYRIFGFGLWLFSPFAWMSVTQLSIPTIGMIIMGQIGILAGSTKLLQSKVRKLGSSQDLRDRHQDLLVRANI